MTYLEKLDTHIRDVIEPAAIGCGALFSRIALHGRR